MNINSLPDLVLRHIFSYLPLLDQVLLHDVCPKWKSLQYSVTCKRKSLTLFVGEQFDPPARSLIDGSSLKIHNLDQIVSGDSEFPQGSTLELSELYYDLTALLVRLFPCISSLCLVLNESDYETVDQVILLLNCWSKSLKSLSFHCLRSLLYLNLTITNNELSQYDATPTFDFYPLTSVKILSLEISMRSHAELGSRHWSIIFPSIQFVEIYTLSEICLVCLPSFEVNPHFPIQIEHIIQQSIKKECLTMLLAPLKQCDQLKKIVTYSSRDTSYEIDDTKKWTFEKLTNEWVCDLHSN